MWTRITGRPLLLGKIDLGPVLLLRIEGVQLGDPLGFLKLEILTPETLQTGSFQVGSGGILSVYPRERFTAQGRLSGLADPTDQMGSQIIKLWSTMWPQPGASGLPGHSSTEERRVSLATFSEALALWSVLCTDLDEDAIYVYSGVAPGILGPMCARLSESLWQYTQENEASQRVVAQAWETSGTPLDFTMSSLNAQAEQNMMLVKEHVLIGFQLWHRLRCEAELEAATLLATPGSPEYVSQAAFLWGTSGGLPMDNLREF